MRKTYKSISLSWDVNMRKTYGIVNNVKKMKTTQATTVNWKLSGQTVSNYGCRWRRFLKVLISQCPKYGHVYFVSIGPKIAKILVKIAAIKSLLNPHFNGFGAITRSGFCWSCFSDHFGMVDVPFRPMDDHFVTILVFFCRFFGKKSGLFS